LTASTIPTFYASFFAICGVEKVPDWCSVLPISAEKSSAFGSQVADVSPI